MTTITTRSKVSIYYTTNPADMGFDGKPSKGEVGAWKTGKADKITSPMKALDFRDELNQIVGQGTYKSIAYFVKGKEVTLEQLEEVAMEGEYRKYANR